MNTQHPMITLPMNMRESCKNASFENQVIMNNDSTHIIAIVIPARYHSARLPGKPLASIAGQTMLSRVWAITQYVINSYDIYHTYDTQSQVSIQAYVTTEDIRIADYCEKHKITCILTSDTCRSGTERVAEAIFTLQQQPNFIINLQGDNALCPPWFLNSIIDQYLQSPREGIITPYVRLGWQELDQLRSDKEKTPFSGTTVVFNTQKQAFWFSKNIIPAIRKESKLRQNGLISPICRHIGLYGYDHKSLGIIHALQATDYETLEGLEQLSFLEAGISMQMVEVNYHGRQGMTGIDSPEDIARAEEIIKQDGEFL